MGVIFKLAIRNMKRRKARYILTTFTLIIGVALFGGILIARDSFKVMFVKDIDNRMGTADILIRESETQDGWFTERKLEDVEDLPHVEYVSYRIAGFHVYTSTEPGGNVVENATKTEVYGIDIDSKDEDELGGRPYIIDSNVRGDTIEEMLDHAGKLIVITESLHIKLGVGLDAGDEIWVLPTDYHLLLGYDEEDRDLVDNNINLWPKYTIAAIIRDLGEARDFDPETPSTYETPSSGPCIFVSIDTAHELVDGIVPREGYYTLAAVGVDDVNNADDVVDDIEDELGDLWAVADLKTDAIEDINDSVDMLMTILMMFALIALILSIILILNILNIIKQEQEYETGMLQAVGASKSETFKMFLIQGIIMGVIGAIIGTICSFFMSYLIFWITIETLKNMPGEFGEMWEHTEFEIILYPQTLAITMSIGLISCVMASLYPSWKASRKPLIECLNPLAKKTEREKKHHKRKVVGLILASLLIAYGTYLLYTSVGYGPEERGDDEGMAESTASIIAPTLILLGIIGITAIFVSPISKGFIMLFGPYLKQTKLLTKKNVLRHHKRTVLTYSMISLTVSYLVAISVIMGSFREGVHTTVNDVMGCDIRIFVGNSPRTLGSDLKDIDGVDDVMGASHQNALLFHEDKNEWIGHGLLEKDWDKSISVHVMETDTVEEHMEATEIIEPEDMTLEDMMDDLSDLNTMIITTKEADYFDLDVDDEIPAKFSQGISYPSISDLLANNRVNAIEDEFVVNLKVIAIVEKFQGFATGQLIGQEEGAYNIYISWQTYEQIAKNNLPGGNTDLIFRQKTQSGNEELDAAQPNWFNFSDVYSTLEGINSINYYTTRMDYFSPTFDSSLADLTKINFTTPVIGMRTNYTSKIKEDSLFGEHVLVNKSTAYQGTTMEELLNTTDNVCVVDQTYVNNMRVNTKNFGINYTIRIFPQQYKKIPDTILIGSFPAGAVTYVWANNGTIDSGTSNDLTTSNNVNMTFISNRTSLILNFTIELGLLLLSNYINPFNITIESNVNSTIDQLDLEVFNFFTNEYDKLGDMKNTFQKNYTFTFNQYYPPFSYINQTNGRLKLRIVGYNSTYSSDYSLDIDKLRLQVLTSRSSVNPLTWPEYKVIGIIKDPVLYKTERYNWLAGSEAYIDVAETENAVYISYDKARTQVFNNYNGSMINGSYDKITHVYINCGSVENIERTYNSLRTSLDNNWTIADLKSRTYEFRTYAFDWYIWIEEGEDDEDILDDIIEYLEDHGYVVLFAFTNSYITQIFETMIDLITLIMNGILVFAIMIAMIGLALHSLLTTMSRRREIGMLRSIGLDRGGVIRTVSGETIIISFLGSIIGILAGLLTGIIMVASIPATGFLTVTLTIPWLTIAILVLVTLGVAIGASWAPARWASNINIIEAVRTR